MASKEAVLEYKKFLIKLLESNVGFKISNWDNDGFVISYEAPKDSHMFDYRVHLKLYNKFIFGGNFIIFIEEFDNTSEFIILNKSTIFCRSQEDKKLLSMFGTIMKDIELKKDNRLFDAMPDTYRRKVKLNKFLKEEEKDDNR